MYIIWRLNVPLIQSKSKKALYKNIETEMNAGKPQDQSLAIAYDIKRRNAKKRKKMADGGILDAIEKWHNAPDPKKEKPKDQINRDLDPVKAGIISDVFKGKSKPKYADGGYVNDSAKTEHRPMPDETDQDSKMVNRNKGNKSPKNDSWTSDVTTEQAQRPSRTPLSRPKMANGILKVRDRDDVLKEEMMMTELAPDDYSKQPDKEYDEVGANRQGPESSDLKLKMMADGGSIEDEADMEDEDSIAAAIMTKRARQNKLMSDSDEDSEIMMAEGGYLNGEDSIYSDDSDQANIARNAEEDKNMEDQSSFDAMRKENYSESEGLSELDSPMDSNEHDIDLDSDEHDMISQIRSKMNRQRQFKVR